MEPLASDGIVTIRPFEPADREQLIAGRDAEWQRWLGPGGDDPHPTACIVVDDTVVGWVDHDSERAWLHEGEVNVGYSVFPTHRGRGYAARAVSLLVRYLGESTTAAMASLLIHPDNAGSLAVARKAGFDPAGEIGGSRYFTRPTDGT